MVTTTCFLQLLGLLCLSLLTCEGAVQNSTTTEKVCQYLGKEFRVGELVTGNPCDRCFCTEHGIMCELLHCPRADCYDKVLKECCYECPNGPNCLYEGANSTVIVPDEGCSYDDDLLCFCYHGDKLTKKEEVICMPAFPGEVRPACKALEP